MDALTITVKHLQRGQPRAYAPHVYEADITIRGEHTWNHLTEEGVKHVVQAAVHPFTEEPSTSHADYYRPRLKSLVKVSEKQLSENKFGPQQEIWRARVEIPFTD